MDPSKYSGRVSDGSTSGKVKWSSPSNIALTKYWGKHGHQLPRNPSISFTLNNAKTITSVSFSPSRDLEMINVDFMFEGRSNSGFAERIQKFLVKNEALMPYVRHFDWTLESENTFPHSSGIASSASAMSCLIAALVDIERRHLDHDLSEEATWKRVSYLSRLASGSACRSVYAKCAQWGQCPGIENSSDLFAIPGETWLHPIFEGYHDDILIVSAEEKEVSSSLGHQMMEDNVYKSVRFDQARNNTIELKQVLTNGDLDRFIEITEGEALTLHALMMTSQPSFILMKPNSLEVIERIRDFRKSTKIPICFTLDAGPNVHILYPEAHAKTCQRFINDELKPLGSRLIEDSMGQGAMKLA